LTFFLYRIQNLFKNNNNKKEIKKKKIRTQKIVNKNNKDKIFINISFYFYLKKNYIYKKI